MTENLMDIKNLKELIGVGKNLMDLSNKGNKLTEDDINKKPLKEVGIAGDLFGDLSNIGNSLKMIAGLTAILSQLGISKEMIDKAMNMAGTLIQAGDLGKKTIKEDSNKTLKDIGLNMDMFKDMNQVGNSLNDISSVLNMIPGMEDSKKDSSGILGSVGSILNKLKKN